MSQELIPHKQLCAIIIKTDDTVAGRADYEYYFLPAEDMARFIKNDMQSNYVSLGGERMVPTWRVYDVRIMEPDEPEIVLSSLSNRQRKLVIDGLRKRYERSFTRPKNAKEMAKYIEGLKNNQKL